MSTEVVEHGTPSGKDLIAGTIRTNRPSLVVVIQPWDALGIPSIHTLELQAKLVLASPSKLCLTGINPLYGPLSSEVFSSLVMSLVSIIVQESFFQGNSSGIDLFELNLSSLCKFWTKILGKPVQPSPLGTADNVVDVEAKFVQASHCRKCMSRGMSEPNPGDVSTFCLWMKSITKVVVYECLQ